LPGYADSGSRELAGHDLIRRATKYGATVARRGSGESVLRLHRV